MNLKHLLSELRLDMFYLRWAAEHEDYSRQQLREAFDKLAEGYLSLVPDEDIAELQNKVRALLLSGHLNFPCLLAGAGPFHW